MNGYERVLTTLHGGVADRVPVMLHGFMAAAKEAGLSMTQFRNSSKYMADAQLLFAEKYGLDGIFVDVDTCLETYAIGVPTDFPEDEPARTSGRLTEDLSVLKDAMRPEKIENDPRISIALEATRRIKESVKNDLAVRGNCDQMAFSLSMISYGMVEFLLALSEEIYRDEILEVLDKAYLVHLKFHELMIQAGADFTSFGDSLCGPEMISREMYMEFSYPFHNKLAMQMKKRGVPVICHICGNLDKILPDVIDAGFPAIEIDYKTDIKRAQNILENRAVMSGCLDPSGVFYYGTPEKVRNETFEMLRTFRGKGLIACSGCALPAGTPEENIRAFVKTVKEYSV
ncbi:hypothetical protein EOM86_01135 [Candidatus Nomurabacteria bacterium]|nr:hypothetical protein [Candidatus Nomurabacteria bacterium]